MAYISVLSRPVRPPEIMAPFGTATDPLPRIYGGPQDGPGVGRDATPPVILPVVARSIRWAVR